MNNQMTNPTNKPINELITDWTEATKSSRSGGASREVFVAEDAEGRAADSECCRLPAIDQVFTLQ